MRRAKSGEKESAPRLIVLLSVCWLILFAIVALLVLLSREPGAIQESKEMITLGRPFSLRGASPSSFARVGASLVRIDDEGIASLDSAGREQTFIPYPYRQPKVIRMGESLMVVPEKGSGYLAILPDISTIEAEADETIHGADYCDEHILTFGPSAKGRTSVILYDTAGGSYRAALSFDSLEWPVRVAFVPDCRHFDVLLLDLTEGRSGTRLLRFDYEGGLLSDRRVSEDELYPWIAYLEDQEILLFNERDLLLVDYGTGAMGGVKIPGELIKVEGAAQGLAVLTGQGGETAFYLVLPASRRPDSFFFEPEEGGQVECFAFASDGSLILAAGRQELFIYDPVSGVLVARQGVESGIREILPLDSHNFLLIYDREARIATVR